MCFRIAMIKPVQLGTICFTGSAIRISTHNMYLKNNMRIHLKLTLYKNKYKINILPYTSSKYARIYI